MFIYLLLFIIIILFLSIYIKKEKFKNLNSFIYPYYNKQIYSNFYDHKYYNLNRFHNIYYPNQKTIYDD